MIYVWHAWRLQSGVDHFAGRLKAIAVGAYADRYWRLGEPPASPLRGRRTRGNRAGCAGLCLLEGRFASVIEAHGCVRNCDPKLVDWGRAWHRAVRSAGRWEAKDRGGN